jgi:hypothetical protein
MNVRQSEARTSVNTLSLTRLDIAFLAVVLIFVYLQLFILPGVPVYVENDQLVHISNAMRLLDGEVMYRDFFHFMPPGTELYYAAVFAFFGIKIWVVSATIFLLAAAQLLVIFIFSKKILSAPFVYLPTLVYFVAGFRLFGIDGSYRLFSVVLVLFSVLIIAFRRSPKTIIWAAALCGVSALFAQNRGLLGVGAIGLFLLWTQWSDRADIRIIFRDWFLAASSFVIVVIVTQFYIAWQGGFDNYFFGNVIFLKDHYGSDTLSNTAAYFSDIPDLNSYFAKYGIDGGLFRFIRVATPTLFFYALVPLIYIAYFAYRKFRTIEPTADRDLMLLSILGTVLYIGASAPTAFRLYHISIPAVIVVVWFFSKLIPSVFFAQALTIGLLTLGLLYSVQRQTTEHFTLELPAGSAAFLSADAAEKYKWLAKETKPSEYIYEAQHPTFYFPLHLKNPTPFYLVRDNNYTPTFQVEQLMRSLESSPPRIIVWHGSWSKEQNERLPGDSLAPLWEFIRTNYRLKKEVREYGEFTVNSERDIEFWERKGHPADSQVENSDRVNP